MVTRLSSSGAIGAATRPRSPRSFGPGPSAATAECAGAVTIRIGGYGLAIRRRITSCRSLERGVKGRERVIHLQRCGSLNSSPTLFDYFQAKNKIALNTMYTISGMLETICRRA